VLVAEDVTDWLRESKPPTVAFSYPVGYVSLVRQRATRITRLDRTLTALADPTRRRLIERVGRRAQRPNELCRGLPMSRPAVSKHLRILREAGLLEAVPQGREMLYRLARRPGGLSEARAYIERVSRTWDRALEAFKAFAEQEST
jgi:DNA-binding transcriptional ArsR family regulator